MQGPKLVAEHETNFRLCHGQTLHWTEWEMELMKLEVLIAGTVYMWRALVGERLMSSRIITESRTW